jgi:FkbM family methyltransferase
MASSRRLDLIEAALIAMVVAIFAFFLGRGLGERSASHRTWAEADARAVITDLERKFGPSRNSENYEEWIVRELVNERRDGVFVDIGASHYRENSNTYFLETTLGWSGVAVDALAEFAADYAAHRPRTKFVSFFVADRSDEAAKLYVNPDHTLVSSSNPEFTKRWGSATPREVPTITMDDLLTKLGIERIDFLSMDIELSEPKALAGFSIRKYRPAVVCIEAHADVRQQILDYFARNGYVPIGRYLWADTSNLWLAPLDESP